jgi:hypothetical protein
MDVVNKTSWGGDTAKTEDVQRIAIKGETLDMAGINDAGLK